MANIELPRDAEGREIPLDTKVLYGEDGKEFEVNYYEYSVRQTIPSRKWQVVMMNCIVYDCSDLYLTPPDGWEKLEEDLNRAVEETNICLYCSKDNTCVNCTIYGNTSKGCSIAAFKDILDRIRKLRGEDE